MQKISSKNNSLFKKIKSLKLRKNREKKEAFLVEGLRIVKEAIEKKADIIHILINEESYSDFLLEQKFLASYNDKILILNREMFLEISDTVNSQGILAVIGVEKEHINLEKIKNIVILDGVQDPGNLGTIIRTSLGFSIDCIFSLKGTVDTYNQKTLRSTMGAIFDIPIINIENQVDFLERLKRESFKIHVADLDAEENLFEYEFPLKTALVFGNEGNGPQLIKKGDVKIKIPMEKQLESLNVSVAAGVILYELYKQRSKNFNI